MPLTEKLVIHRKNPALCRCMEIQEIMSQNIISVSEEDTVYTAARTLAQNDIGALPVSNNGRICGIITDRDITVRCVAEKRDIEKTKVKEIMTGSVACLSPKHTIKDAVEIMSCEQVRRIPVIENGKLAGMVSVADIAKARCGQELTDIMEEISLPSTAASGTAGTQQPS